MRSATETSTTANPLAASRLRLRLERWNRKLHYYAGLFLLFFLWLFAASAPMSAETLFVAKPLTREGEFTKGIEGPAVDRKGTLFAVNFGSEQTIGKVTPNGKAELYVTLPGKGVGDRKSVV